MVKLLDCTLREAPLLAIGKDNINKTISYLEEAKVDFLECAFICNNIDYKEGSTHFNSVDQIEKYLQYKKPGICYTACTQWPDYDIKLLSEFNGKSVDGIRYVHKKGQVCRSIEALKVIIEKGYKAFLQSADTVSYSAEELIEIIEKINKIKPYAYSISDTFGTMYLEDVRCLFEIVDERLDRNILFGFHTHNNLLMANANAQEFLSLCYASGRDCFIDCSVWGCGIGAGNAKTELAIPYLNKIYRKDYNIYPILNIIDEVIPDIQKRSSWGYEVPSFLSGLTGAVTTHADFLAYYFKDISSEDILKIVNTMDIKERKTNDVKITQNKYFVVMEEQLEKLNTCKSSARYNKLKKGLQKAKLKKRIAGLRDSHPILFNALKIIYDRTLLLKRILKI